jgi:hypothetical protein
MSLFKALGVTLLRAGVATLAFALASALAFAGGGGSGGFTLAASIGLAGLAWSVLPAIRASRVLAALAVLGWFYVGFRLWQFGAQEVKGWMLGPWLVATVVMVAGLVSEPPRYARALLPWRVRRSSEHDAA